MLRKVILAFLLAFFLMISSVIADGDGFGFGGASNNVNGDNQQSNSDGSLVFTGNDDGFPTQTLVSANLASNIGENTRCTFNLKDKELDSTDSIGSFDSVNDTTSSRTPMRIEIKGYLHENRAPIIRSSINSCKFILHENETCASPVVWSTTYTLDNSLLNVLQTQNYTIGYAELGSRVGKMCFEVESIYETTGVKTANSTIAIAPYLRNFTLRNNNSLHYLEMQNLSWDLPVTGIDYMTFHMINVSNYAVLQTFNITPATSLKHQLSQFSVNPTNGTGVAYRISSWTDNGTTHYRFSTSNGNYYLDEIKNSGVAFRNSECVRDSSTDKIYCIGGYFQSTSSPNYNNVTEFDPVTRTATSKNINYKNTWHSCAENSATNKIYCFNGTGTAAGGPESAIYEYVPATNTMSLFTRSPRTFYESECVENSATHKIYCFGGYSNGLAVREILEFDPVANTTVIKANMPTPRVATACAENPTTNKIYCIGGKNATSDPYTTMKDIFEYDPSTNTVTNKTELPYNVHDASCTSASDSKIYCFGGQTPGVTMYDGLIFIYDSVANRVNFHAYLMDNVRQRHSCERGRTGEIYCFGGMNSTNEIYNESLLFFNLSRMTGIEKNFTFYNNPTCGTLTNNDLNSSGGAKRVYTRGDSIDRNGTLKYNSVNILNFTENVTYNVRYRLKDDTQNQFSNESWIIASDGTWRKNTRIPSTALTGDDDSSPYDIVLEVASTTNPLDVISCKYSNNLDLSDVGEKPSADNVTANVFNFTATVPGYTLAYGNFTQYCNYQMPSLSCNTNPTSSVQTVTNDYNVSLYITTPTLGTVIEPGSLIPIDFRIIRNQSSSERYEYSIKCSHKINGAWVDSETSYATDFNGSVSTRLRRHYCYANNTYGITHYKITVTDAYVTTSNVILEYNKSSLNASLNGTSLWIGANALNPSNSTSIRNVTVFSQLRYGTLGLPQQYLGALDSRTVKNNKVNSSQWWVISTNSTVLNPGSYDPIFVNNTTYTPDGVLVVEAKQGCFKRDPVTMSCLDDDTKAFLNKNISVNSTHVQHLNFTDKRAYNVVATVTAFPHACTSVTCKYKASVYFTNGGEIVTYESEATPGSNIYFNDILTTGTNSTLVINASTDAVLFSATCVGINVSTGCPHFGARLSNVSINGAEQRIALNTSAEINLSQLNHTVKFDLINPNGTIESTGYPMSNLTNSLGEINATIAIPVRAQAGNWTVKLTLENNRTPTQSDRSVINRTIALRPVINETLVYFYEKDNTSNSKVSDEPLNRVNINKTYFVNATVYNNPNSFTMTAVLDSNGTSYPLSCSGFVCSGNINSGLSRGNISTRVSVNVTNAVGNATGRTSSGGLSVESPVINISNIYNIVSLSNATFNRGETISTLLTMTNVRDEPIASNALSLYLMNPSELIKHTTTNSTNSNATVGLSGYKFLSTDNLGNWIIVANDTAGNNASFTFSLEDTIKIGKFFVNSKDFSSINNVTYYTGETLSPIISWLEVRNARGELTSLFDNMSLYFNVTNPKNGSNVTEFRINYTNTGVGNYTLTVGSGNYSYTAGNATASIMTNDSNNNDNIVISPSDIGSDLTSASKSLINTYIATNITANDTRILRSQTARFDLRAYEAWNDTLDDSLLNASGSVAQTTCSFTLRFYNDTRADDASSSAQYNETFSNTTGMYQKDVTISSTIPLGLKDVQTNTSCGNNDGANWNNLTNRNSGRSDGSGLITIDDLNPHKIAMNSRTPDEVLVYQAGQVVNVTSNFTYALLGSLASSEAYGNLTMRVTNSTGSLVSGITNNLQTGTGTDAGGNANFSFTIGDSVESGRYFVNISTLYGSINKSFYVAGPATSQYAAIQTRTNGSAYYERNFTLTNLEGSTKTFIIKNECPSGAEELNSTDVSNNVNSIRNLGSLGNYTCNDKNITDLANSGSQSVHFVFKKFGIVNMTEGNWLSDASRESNETVQYIYKNFTLINTDPSITFYNVSYNVSTPAGAKCYSGCNSSNTSVNATANANTLNFANASGAFINVTKYARPAGSGISTGKWEQDPSLTSTTDTQYLRQIVNLSLDATYGGIITTPINITWNATLANAATGLIASNGDCRVQYTCTTCGRKVTVPLTGILTDYANGSGDCISEFNVSNSWVQDDTNTTVNSTAYVKGTLRLGNLDEQTRLNVTYNNSINSTVARADTTGNWKCSVDSGYELLTAGQTVDTSSKPIRCSINNSIINNTFGAETSTETMGSLPCSVKFRKNIVHYNKDPIVNYTNVTSNVSVSDRLTIAGANISCNGGANISVNLSAGSNATNFVLNSVNSSGFATCTLYWNKKGAGVGLNATVLNKSVVQVGASVLLNLSLYTPDSNSTENLNNLRSSIYLVPGTRVVGVDEILKCSSLTGQNVGCSFKPSEGVRRDIEEPYTIVVKSTDAFGCSDVGSAVDKIYVDTKSPRIINVIQNTTNSSINGSVIVNATFEDLNVTSVILSYLPNQSENSSYINETIANFTNAGNSVSNYTANYTFNLTKLNQTYNTTVGTRIKYFLHALDSAGNIKATPEQSFYIPCQAEHRQLEIKARPVSLLTGNSVTSGTVSIELYDSTGTRVDRIDTAIRPEEQGGISSISCKPQSSLKSGEKYKVIMKIKSGSETTYHVEEFVAP